MNSITSTAYEQVTDTGDSARMAVYLYMMRMQPEIGPVSLGGKGAEGPSSVGERLDPQTLAALLEGTLNASEREHALAVIARSDQSYRDLVAAMKLNDQLAAIDQPSVEGIPEVEPSRPSPVAARPGPPARFRKWRFVAPVLAAASLAVALRFQRFSERNDASRQAVMAINAAAPRGVTRAGVTMLGEFGRDWNRVAWSETRGSETQLPASARAFRLGVRFAELELASSVGDSSAVASARHALVATASGIEGATLVAPLVDRVAATRKATPADLIAVVSKLRALSSPAAMFDIGAWCETARLAIAAGRGAEFRDNGWSRRELQRIVAQVGRFAAADRAVVEPIIAPLRPWAATPSTTASDLSLFKIAVDSAIAVGTR